MVHWRDISPDSTLGETRIVDDLGLIDLCEPFETIELWIDPDPNAQLILIWLLDYLRPHDGHRFEADIWSRPNVRIGNSSGGRGWPNGGYPPSRS